MKILYVCHEPLPSPYTNTEQIIKTAAALAAEGVQTDVICPAWATASGGRDERAKSIAAFYGIPTARLRDGLRIVECDVPSPIRGKAARPWHDIRAAIYARASDYDLVYTRDPFSLLAALFAHDRVVFETYRVDLNTQLRFSPWRSACYTRPNLLGAVAHSHIAEASFFRAGFHPDRVLVAHNGFAPELMVPRRTKAEARADLQLPREGCLVTYAGHVDRTKGLDTLLPMARHLADVRFLLVGYVPGSQGWLARRIAQDGLTNVSLVPRVAPSEIVPYLYAADCLLIPPSARPLRSHGRTVLPLKTFLYLAAGRPILAPDLPDLREVLRDDVNAVLVAPDAPEVAARALRALLSDHQRQERLGNNAMASSARYTWSARARKIAAFVDRLLRGR